jgi:hypothetical protein
MIYRRIVANLRAQNWAAISIELGIVIVGVFIGTMVANWNQQRVERAETQRMLGQLKPSLDYLDQYFETARRYYAVTRRYAETAQAGWTGDPKVSDRDFVIAAYQASQIIGVGTNGSAWASVLGADRLKQIDDPRLRADLSTLMSSDYSVIDVQAVDTPYRRNVRRLIPLAIQDRIRTHCGDRGVPNQAVFITLPATCDIGIAPGEAAETAAKLRANRDVLDDLNWHIAAQSASLGNMTPFIIATRGVRARIGAARR